MNKILKHLSDGRLVYQKRESPNIGIIYDSEILETESIFNSYSQEISENKNNFYPIEYTDKGEKVHRAVTEKNVYPRFIDLAPLIKEFKMFPTLISESKNSQDIGALEMKRIMSEI